MPNPLCGLFLVQGPDSPSSRYRVLQFVPYLERQGVRCAVKSFPSTVIDRARVLRRIGEFDFVFVQRKRFGPWATWLLRHTAKSLVFDFDDAIMFHDSQSSARKSSSRQRQFARSVRAADLVLCGNQFIRNLSAKQHANSVLFPTVVDTERYPQKSYADQAQVTLGWIGSRSTLPYLQQLRPVFESIGRRRRDICLKIVCDTFFELENMPVLKVPWNQQTEVDEVQSFDIGLMPLSDDVWSKGKCGLKLLQCHAAGVPVVASPVGVNAALVEEGVTGLRATTHTEWIEKIVKLADDRLGRERMGREGRRRTIENYSLQSQAPVLLSLLQDLVRQSSLQVPSEVRAA